MGLAALGLWIAAVLAGSPEPRVQQIQWDAAEGCPSQPAVLAATDEFLGGRRLAEFPRSVLAQAWVEVDPAGYRLRLVITVDGVREHHELRAVDCDQIGRDAALLLASAVDPFALGPPPPRERQLTATQVIVQRPTTRPKVVVVAKPMIASEPVSESTTSTPIMPIPSSVTIDRPPPPRERRPRQAVTGTLGVAGLGFVGLFPQVDGGVEIEGGLQRGLFRWQLAAAGWFGGQFRAANADVGGDLTAASIATGFCVAPSRRTIRFSACAIVGAGPVVATSVNTQNDLTRVQPWAFAGPDLRVTWSPRPRFGLYLGIAALPALVRPGWIVDDPQATYRVPPVLGLLRAGIELGRLQAR